jgi:broad specificity phosphatase PhoE
MDSPLTEKGAEQAARLGELIADGRPVARVVASPLKRAVDTAEALGLGIPVEIDQRWVEVDYGRFDGERLKDVPSAVWRSWRADPEYRPDEGETLAELGVRVRQACEELFAEEGKGARADEDIIVVSHVSPIKAAVGWALGAGDSIAWRLWLANASLTVIGWGSDGPVLRRYNLVSHQDAVENP